MWKYRCEISLNDISTSIKWSFGFVFWMKLFERTLFMSSCAGSTLLYIRIRKQSVNGEATQRVATRIVIDELDAAICKLLRAFKLLFRLFRVARPRFTAPHAATECQRWTNDFACTVSLSSGGPCASFNIVPAHLMYCMYVVRVCVCAQR